MKIKYYAFLLFVLLAFGCKNETSTVSKTSFVKTFAGTIGEKYDIVLKVKVDEGRAEGSYYYQKTGKLIKLKGSIDDSGIVNFDEFDENGNQTGQFKGKLIGNSKITGTWSKPDGGKATNYSIIESNIDFEQSARECLLKASAKKEIKTSTESAKKYTKSDLFGNWWTPHFAVRKIKFNVDDTFVFDDGGGNIFKGTYEFDGVMAHITFKNKLDKWLKMSGGGEHSFVLSGDGENFVKEWDESH